MLRRQLALQVPPPGGIPDRAAGAADGSGRHAWGRRMHGGAPTARCRADAAAVPQPACRRVACEVRGREGALVVHALACLQRQRGQRRRAPRLGACAPDALQAVPLQRSARVRIILGMQRSLHTNKHIHKHSARVCISLAMQCSLHPVRRSRGKPPRAQSSIAQKRSTA